MYDMYSEFYPFVCRDYNYDDLMYFEEKIKENTPCKIIKIYDKRLLPGNRVLLNRIRRYC